LMPFLRVSHLFVGTRRERKLTKDKRKDHAAVDEPSLE